jgi:hypothetical protein
MGGNTESARQWFAKAVESYRESYEHAPPGSWGRPIGILKARILAGDWQGAETDARWTLEQGAVEAPSPIGATPLVSHSSSSAATRKRGWSRTTCGRTPISPQP